MSQKNRKFGYAISPNCIRHLPGLSLLAKCVHIEILNLSGKEGYCWASNKYLADIFEVHPITISKEIAELKKLGIISTEMIEGKGKKTLRKLVPTDAENLETSLATRLRTPKCSDLGGHKSPDLGGPKCSALGVLSVGTKHINKKEKTNTDKSPLSDSDASLDITSRDNLFRSVEKILSEKIPRRSLLPELQAAVAFWFAETISGGKHRDTKYYTEKLAEKITTYDFDGIILALWIVAHSSWMRKKKKDWVWMITHTEPKIDMALGGKYDCDLPASDSEIYAVQQITYLLSNPSKLYAKAGINIGGVPEKISQGGEGKKGRSFDDL